MKKETDRRLAKPIAPALIALSLAAVPVLAQTVNHSMTHSGSHTGHAMAAEDSPSTKAFRDANMKMHAGMEIDYTGDADVDFIRGMIAHHQGAIDMARIVLEHGDDPEVKKLAEAIIAAQQGEIAWMQDWLAKHGG